jgi:nicotinamidase/pyrazinamidase
VISRDWHPPHHVSFTEEGGPWPVHCLQFTPGAELHPGLEVPARTLSIFKGADPHADQYSAFDTTGLGKLLRKREVRRTWIGGLAQDVCVRATALDAAREGFEVHVILPATRPVDARQGQETLRELLAAGIALEESLQPAVTLRQAIP